MAEFERELRRMACTDCGRLLDAEIRESGLEDKLVFVVFPDHACNPAMLRFWNPDSQHEPPWGRG